MKKALKVIAMLLIPLSAGIISACSTRQTTLQSDLVYASENGGEFVLKEGVKIEALHSKPGILKPGARWYTVGSIEQGVVYNTKDQVIVVNSFNVYEGYIVVNQGNVVGYYLPTEKTFVKTKPVTISLSTSEDSQ